MNNDKTKKRKVSVIGDSISTYFGFTDFDYPVYYGPESAYINGIESVDDIWWKRIIDRLGGELCVNNSYSGSYVAGIYESSACTAERCTRLSKNGPPDVVLIYIGTNDRGDFVTVGGGDDLGPETFYGAYRVMLRQIRETYPAAKVICGTLLFAYREDDGEPKRRGPLPHFAQEINDAIKRAAATEGCFVADIAAYNEQYETLDYCHPTKVGHKTLADLWLKELEKIL